jgi:Leucine-rich repeat (LRR) protein
MCVGRHGCNCRVKNLVVLSLLKSHITQLPKEIGLLTRLRMLDLSNCFKFEAIPPNVISNLVALEELYMEIVLFNGRLKDSIMLVLLS